MNIKSITDALCGLRSEYNDKVHLVVRTQPGASVVGVGFNEAAFSGTGDTNKAVAAQLDIMHKGAAWCMDHPEAGVRIRTFYKDSNGVSRPGLGFQVQAQAQSQGSDVEQRLEALLAKAVGIGIDLDRYSGVSNSVLLAARLTAAIKAVEGESTGNADSAEDEVDEGPPA